MEPADLIVFMSEAARRQYIRRTALDRGFVDAERITTFARLRTDCARAARRAGLLQRPEADAVSRALLLRAAADEAAAAFAGKGVLGRAAPAALAEVLENMADTLAPLGHAAEAIQAWLLRGPAESKARQLGLLYETYRRRLDRAARADARDVNAAVLELLHSPPSNWPAALARPGVGLHLRALTWLDPFAEQFVGALLERLGTQHVRLSSALPPAHAERMEDRLAARIRTEVLAGLDQEPWSSWTESLGDAWEVEDAQLAADSRDRLSFLRSAGLNGEVEDLARRIRAEMDQHHVPPERIALVARQPDDYLDAVTRVFKEFGIPYFCRRRRPAADTAPVRVLMALLQFPLDPTRERLCALLTSPALAWPGWNSLSARQEAAEAILASGIGPVLQAEDWRPPRGAARRIPDAVREPVQVVLSQMGLWNAPAGEFSLGDHARSALALADLLGLVPGSLPPDGPAEREALDQARALLRRLEQESDAAGARHTRGAFLDLYGRLLADLAVPAGSPEEYGVWIMSPADMAGLSFDVVFVAGLHEGSFPAVAREDAVFSDEERAAMHAALARHGVRLPQWSLPLSSIRSAQERFLFLSCIGAARERLVLSCQATDGEGRDLNPGDFFRSLWALAGDSKDTSAPAGESWRVTLPLPECRTPGEARRRLGRLIERPSAARDSEPALLRKLPAAPAAGNGERLARVIGVEHAREEFFNRTAGGRAAEGSHCGRLNSPAARRQIEGWLAGRGALSPTSLEILARCRYRFLLGAVLGLGPARLREDAPDAMDRGRVIHDILDQVYRGLRGDEGQPDALATDARAAFADLLRTRAWAVAEKPGAWVLRDRPGPSGARSLPLVAFDPGARDRCLDYIRAVADAVVLRAERAGLLLGNPGVWETEKPKLACIAENYVRLDMDLAGGERRFPALLELPFGGRDGPPLRVGPGLGARGRVDRVDLVFDEGGRLSGLLVVDYKSPGRGGQSKVAYAEEIAENLDCQLPVYAFAAQQALFGRCNEPELNAMTAAVFHIQDRDRKKMETQFTNRRIGLGDDDSGSITGRFMERLAGNMERLRAADFAVDPLDCDLCDFRHICRVDVNALQSAAAGAGE
ncbi:MAG TPA: PD-(D/E)XK nuclease family protein [Kiritimatiellia bacterium]|nr:PD-(D/E)XK nuclease family protein [Kiritimatiellia bacterium]HRZ11135.1 PD-(D/E)XK nuclease family protein [Kiritimatiellia bacterium]HSA19493.1 PD-(D/E)XK nuclease family protein [Kiritimatiellia bacterium]